MRAQLQNRALSWVVSCWVGLWLGWVVPCEVGSSAKGEVSTAAAHASGRPLPVFLASPPSKACAMRSPASSEQRDRPSGLLCGRLLVALVERVLRPGGWAHMCRLMCHCVRHIGLDNKHGRSVEAILPLVPITLEGLHGALRRHTEEPCGKRRARWGARTVRFSGVT